MFVFFNLTFFPLFAAGFLDMPRRVSTYAPHLQVINDFVSASAFCLGISMLIFVGNLIYSLVFARIPRRAEPVALARARVAGADAGAGAQLRRACPRSPATRTTTASRARRRSRGSGRQPRRRGHADVSTPEASVPIPVEHPELEARVVDGRLVPARRRHRLLLRRLPVRVPLPAGAELERALALGQAGTAVRRRAIGMGSPILVCVLVSVVLVRLALQELRTRGRPVWRLAGLAALLGGLAAIGLQCWEYTRLGVETSLTLTPEREGGYASVYLGWTGFFTIFVFGAMLWLETILASSRTQAASAAENAAGVTGLSLFWTMLGLVEIAAFILLYGVK